MNLDKIEECTFCGNSLKDFKIILSLKLMALRQKQSSVWEVVENNDVTSNEVLCKDCYSDFADVITSSMEEKAKKRNR